MPESMQGKKHEFIQQDAGNTKFNHKVFLSLSDILFLMYTIKFMLIIFKKSLGSVCF